MFFPSSQKERASGRPPHGSCRSREVKPLRAATSQRQSAAGPPGTAWSGPFSPRVGPPPVSRGLPGSGNASTSGWLVRGLGAGVTHEARAAERRQGGAQRHRSGLRAASRRRCGGLCHPSTVVHPQRAQRDCVPPQMASVSSEGVAGLQALEAHINGLYGGKLVPEDEVRKICDKAKEILTKEQNVVSLRAPITIVRPLPISP